MVTEEKIKKLGLNPAVQQKLLQLLLIPQYAQKIEVAFEKHELSLGKKEAILSKIEGAARSCQRDILRDVEKLSYEAELKEIENEL